MWELGEGKIVLMGGYRTRSFVMTPGPLIMVLQFVGFMAA
jgi:hypothetical protein